jgi:zinc protease
LVVTGDVDAEATLTDVKKWLGPWLPAKSPFPAVPPLSVRAVPTKVLVTNQPGATQAQVHLACLADGRTLPQELSHQTLASLVSTTLFEKIRGELGASYGFGGGASPLVGGTTRIDWSGSIDNNRLPQAMAVLAKTLKAFEQETLNEPALARARWSVARESTMSGATASMVARALTDEVLAGRKTEDVDAALFEALAKVDRDQLLASWKQCQGNLVLSIVGDEPRVKEALTSSGW